MHYGEFAGKNSSNILILGESHHISKYNVADMIAGVKASYKTEECMYDYFNNRTNQDYFFFDKIVESFGFNPDEEREKFWHSVYFGNYVNVLCGVGDNTAKKMIRENREKYNDELFTFVNRHNISTVFCFSINVFNNGLPALNNNSDETSKKQIIGKLYKKNVYIRHCLYRANVEHAGSKVILDNDLEIYGIGHPSSRGGYCPQLMQSVLKGKLQLK